MRLIFIYSIKVIDEINYSYYKQELLYSLLKYKKI